MQWNGPCIRRTDARSTQSGRLRELRGRRSQWKELTDVRASRLPVRAQVNEAFSVDAGAAWNQDDCQGRHLLLNDGTRSTSHAAGCDGTKGRKLQPERSAARSRRAPFQGNIRAGTRSPSTACEHSSRWERCIKRIRSRVPPSRRSSTRKQSRAL